MHPIRDPRNFILRNRVTIRDVVIQLKLVDGVFPSLDQIVQQVVGLVLQAIHSIWILQVLDESILVWKLALLLEFTVLVPSILVGPPSLVALLAFLL